MTIAGGVNTSAGLYQCHCTCARCCRQLAARCGNYSVFSPVQCNLLF